MVKRILTDTFNPQQIHPADVIVYRDGDYAVVVKRGLGEIYRSTNHTEAIQYAINSLTPNRTWKETIKIIGKFSTTLHENESKIKIPPYTIIEGPAEFDVEFAKGDNQIFFDIDGSCKVEIRYIKFNLKGFGGSSQKPETAIAVRNGAKKVTIEKIDVLDKRSALDDAYWVYGIHIGTWGVSTRENKYIEIRDSYFYSDGRENRAFMAIRVSSAEKVFIENCYIQGRELDEPYNNKIGYAPLQIIASDEVIVRNTIVVGSHHNLITTDVYDTETPDMCKRLRFENLILLGGFDDAIDPNYTEDSVVVGCIIDNTIGVGGPEGDGISLEHCFRWVISGNFIRATRCGINTPSGPNPDIVITGNWIEGRVAGIQLTNVAHSVVVGNRIFSPNIGILLEYPGYSLIVGNTIIVSRKTDVDAVVYGIKATVVPGTVFIVGNRIETVLTTETDAHVTAYGIYAEESLRGFILCNYISPYAYRPAGNEVRRWIHLNRSDGKYRCYIMYNIVSYDALIQGAELPIIKNNIGYRTENSGIATLSGDGSTTEFVLGEHGLDVEVTDPSKVIVNCTPASPDAIAASPVVCYLSDEDGDGVYESIRAKFASAPPSGTDNVKVVWEVEYIG